LISAILIHRKLTQNAEFLFNWQFFYIY